MFDSLGHGISKTPGLGNAEEVMLAPALAETDVGVAIAGGTDLARESSDVTLLGDNLGRLPWAIGLASEARRKIRQNLGWAFGYNLVAIGIAAFGYLHPLRYDLASQASRPRSAMAFAPRIMRLASSSRGAARTR